jgi:hypothetical protein
MKKFAWSSVAVWFTFLFLCVASVAFAADGAVVSGGWDSWKGLVKGIGAGILSGLSVAALGFAKDKDPNKKFSLQEASGTLLIGAISGAIAGFEKKDLTKPEDWYSTATAVVLAELIIKAVWRNTAPKIAKIVSTFKGDHKE